MNKEARDHLAAHRKYVILEYAKANMPRFWRAEIYLLRMEKGLCRGRQSRTSPQETDRQESPTADPT